MVIFWKSISIGGKKLESNCDGNVVMGNQCAKKLANSDLAASKNRLELRRD
jgi:hypothetical protein